MSRVFVLGNAGMDLSLALPRLPAGGETLVAAQISRAPGGKGLNQAVVAARAGAAVLFCAPVGNDDDAAAIAAVLAGEALVDIHLHRLAQHTDLSILMVAPDGENCIVTAGACADALDPDTAEAFVGGMAAGDVLLLQGNLSLATTRAAAEAAIRGGGRIMLNAAPLRWPATSLIRLCDVIVVNEVEAAGIAGTSGEAAAGWLHKAGARRAIVTLGASGCAVADDTGTATLPGYAVRAVDTTGAGDTFCGVLASRLAACDRLDGQGWHEAIAAAQRAAAVAVMRPGAYAALPSSAELRASAGLRL